MEANGNGDEEEAAMLDEADTAEVIDLPENSDGVNGIVNDVDDMGIEVDAAAAGEEMVDEANMVFSEHKSAVFCVKIDPGTSTKALTGGQDDRAFVWEIGTGRTIFECSGQTDSVTSVGFSFDGQYFATADMNGCVQVWKFENFEKVWSFESTDIEWLEWHPKAHVLLAGTSEGNTWVWKIPSGEFKTLQGHGQSVSCGRVLPDGLRACTGYADGVVKVWDLRAAICLHSITGQNGHSGSVVAMDCHHDNTLVITGSNDVTAKIINTQTGAVLTSFQCASDLNKDADQSDAEDSVEAVGFARTQTLAATGSLSGSLCIWDVPTSVCRHTCMHEGGIVKLRWEEASPMLYTAGLDGVLRLWDARNGEAVAQWRGHSQEILDFDLAKDSSTVITTSEDNTARVFSLHIPDR